MREAIAKSVTSTVKDLYKSGLVDVITMKNIEKLCIPEVQVFVLKKADDIPISGLRTLSGMDYQRCLINKPQQSSDSLPF